MRGFYPTKDGVFGKRGAVRLMTNEGLIYHIFEVVVRSPSPRG